MVTQNLSKEFFGFLISILPLSPFLSMLVYFNVLIRLIRVTIYLLFFSFVSESLGLPLYPSWLTSPSGAMAVPKRPKVWVPVRATGSEKVSGASCRYRYTLPTSLGLLSISLSMKSGAPTSTSSVLGRQSADSVIIHRKRNRTCICVGSGGEAFYLLIPIYISSSHRVAKIGGHLTERQTAIQPTSFIQY